MRVLILCTGNTCRSQMAEGFIRNLAPEIDVFSAGTAAEEKVNPYAIKVMNELGIDISSQQVNSVQEFLNQSFDYVVTVCDGAREQCPVFSGQVKQRLHVGFEDPATARGSDEEVLNIYRQVRDAIRKTFLDFINTWKKEEREQIKSVVRKQYANIALCAGQEDEDCCNGCCRGPEETPDYSMFSVDSKALQGYFSDADLSLGCGLPTAYAKISEGDTVIDLGSGAGNDSFIARAICGENGHVIGVDFTDEMIRKSRENAKKLEYSNVDFFLGDIEKMPLESNIADVVISNCVLNLVPDKEKAFAEILRVLKKSGHFCISDVVLSKPLSGILQKNMELYAGCIAGAITKVEYLKLIRDAGFENIQIKKERKIEISEQTLFKLAGPGIIKEFKLSDVEIYSITVYAEKPGIVIMNNYNFSLPED